MLAFGQGSAAVAVTPGACAGMGGDQGQGLAVQVQPHPAAGFGHAAQGQGGRIGQLRVCGAVEHQCADRVGGGLVNGQVEGRRHPTGVAGQVSGFGVHGVLACRNGQGRQVQLPVTEVIGHHAANPGRTGGAIQVNADQGIGLRRALQLNGVQAGECIAGTDARVGRDAGDDGHGRRHVVHHQGKGQGRLALVVHHVQGHGTEGVGVVAQADRNARVRVTEVPQTVAVGCHSAECASDTVAVNAHTAVRLGAAIEHHSAGLRDGICRAAPCVQAHAGDLGRLGYLGVNGQVLRFTLGGDVACQIGGCQDHRIAAIGQVAAIGVKLPGAIVEHRGGAQKHMVGHHPDDGARFCRALQLGSAGLGIKTDKTIDVDGGAAVDFVPDRLCGCDRVQHDVQNTGPARQQGGCGASHRAVGCFHAGLDAKSVAVGCGQVGMAECGQCHDGRAAGDLQGAQTDAGQAGAVCQCDPEGIACRDADRQGDAHAHAIDLGVVVRRRASRVVAREQVGCARGARHVQVADTVRADVEVARVVASVVLQSRNVIVEAGVAVGQRDLLATVDRLGQRDLEFGAVVGVYGDAADGHQLAVDSDGKCRGGHRGLHGLAQGQGHFCAVVRNAAHQGGGDSVGGFCGDAGVVHVQRQCGCAGLELGIGGRLVAGKVDRAHHQGVVALHQLRAGVGEVPVASLDAGFAQ